MLLNDTCLNAAIPSHIIQLCSGITRGRVLNGELCTRVCSDD